MCCECHFICVILVMCRRQNYYYRTEQDMTVQQPYAIQGVKGKWNSINNCISNVVYDLENSFTLIRL